MVATRRWHLTFPEEQVQQPLVYRLVADHGLVINIRRADVDAKVGWMILEVQGSQEALDAGRAYLSEAGVTVTDPSGDVLQG